jgi:hypothetical protein
MSHFTDCLEVLLGRKDLRCFYQCSTHLHISSDGRPATHLTQANHTALGVEDACLASADIALQEAGVALAEWRRPAHKAMQYTSCWVEVLS